MAPPGPVSRRAMWTMSELFLAGRFPGVACHVYMGVALDELPMQQLSPASRSAVFVTRRGRGCPVVCASLTGLDSTLAVHLNGVRTSNMPKEEIAVVVDVEPPWEGVSCPGCDAV